MTDILGLQARLVNAELETGVGEGNWFEQWLQVLQLVDPDQLPEAHWKEISQIVRRMDAVLVAANGLETFVEAVSIGVEEPVVEESPVVAEEPAVETPMVVEDPVVETPVVVEEPVVETPVVEETPVVQVPQVAAPKTPAAKKPPPPKPASSKPPPPKPASSMPAGAVVAVAVVALPSPEPTPEIVDKEEPKVVAPPSTTKLTPPKPPASSSKLAPPKPPASSSKLAPPKPPASAASTASPVPTATKSLPPPPSPVSKMADNLLISKQITDLYSELKLRSKHRYLIFKINPQDNALELEALGPKTDTLESFLHSLPYAECRFAVYDHEWLKTDQYGSRITSKAFFVTWTPTPASTQHKMWYSTERKQVLQVFTGVETILATTKHDVLVGTGTKNKLDADHGSEDEDGDKGDWMDD